MKEERSSTGNMIAGGVSLRNVLLAAFASGLISMVLQTLVFRSFFTVFDGNEWSVALFFFSWLFWGAVGAGLARAVPIAYQTGPYLPLLLTGYLPAGGLQFYLAHTSRRMAGLTAFDSFTAFSILPGVLLANAPASLISGMLFVFLVRAAEQIQPDGRRTASHIYIWEAVGAFAGGALVTALLYCSFTSIRISLLLALLPALVWLGMIIPPRSARMLRHGIIPAALALLSLYALFTGLDTRLTHTLDRRAWENLLPGGHWIGTFTTAANRYLFGTYQDQFSVMTGTSIIESLPNRDSGERLALLLLAQQPDAASVLLIGPGLLPLARALEERSPSVHSTWLNPDADYAHQLLQNLPRSVQTPFPPPQTPREPVRKALADSTQRFDAAVIHLATDDTMANALLFTPAFLHQIKSRMNPTGTLYLSIETGANYMGREQTLAATTLYRSLDQCFQNVVVFAGPPSWLAASDAPTLSAQPDLLIQHLRSALPDWTGLPPEMLHELCNPRRAAMLRQTLDIESTALAPLVTHTIAQPRLTLFSSLAMLRKANPNMPDLTTILPFLTRAAFLLLLLPALWFLAHAMLPALSNRAHPTHPNTACLILFAGFSGFALNYLLLILFQAYFGTLFLRIGWLCALFMIGLCAGGTLLLRLLQKTSLPVAARIELTLYLFTCIATGLLLRHPFPLLFDLLFLLAGASTAGFIPLAEALLREQPFTPDQIARRIAWSDHLGGALAALCCGLLILPLIGMARLLILLALAAPALLLPLCRTTFHAAPHAPIKAFNPTPLLLLLTAAISAWFVYDAKQPRTFITASKLSLHMPRIEQAPTHAPETTPGWTTHTLQLSEGILFPYEEQFSTDPSKHLYRFHTLPLAGEIHGFRGPIPMRITLTEQGKLIDITYLDHQETPVYFVLAEKASRPLIGQNIRRDTLPAADAVTGASTSANAIRETLLAATERFFQLLAGAAPPSAATMEWDIPSDPLPGIPRNINLRLIRAMIERGELSDHPALHQFPHSGMRVKLREREW